MADTTASVARVIAPVEAPLGSVAELPVKSRSYWSTVLGRLRRDPVTLTCAGILLAILLSAIFAPVIVEADPYKTSMLRRLQAVGSPGHLLGTDELGRDMIARLVYGGRLSLLNGTLPVINALLIGGLLGVTAGFIGGWVNMLIMRTIDVFYAFPSVLLAIAISRALRAGLTNAIVALAIVFMPPVARVSESVTTSVRTLDFVEAARASGARSWTIIRVHILGHVLGPIFIYATRLISVALILSSGLSFLGLGVKPPQPEWGLMLNTLRQSIWVNPVVAALPGAIIFVTSICFNLMSDGLRSAMDIKL